MGLLRPCWCHRGRLGQDGRVGAAAPVGRLLTAARGGIVPVGSVALGSVGLLPALGCLQPVLQGYVAARFGAGSKERWFT